VSIYSKEQQYTFPVRAVKKVVINKEVYKGTPTKWDVTLKMDHSCGYESVPLNLMDMTMNDEVEYYLVSLPTLIAEKVF
jgi:hypothetical protein